MSDVATSPAPATEPVVLRVPLALRIFMLFAILIGLALGSVIWITQRKGAEIADQSVSRTMTLSASTQSEFTQRRLEDLQLKLQVIASDTAFLQYVNESTGAALGLGSERSDGASLEDLLQERKQTFGFDLAILLNPKGEVLVRTDESEAFATTLGGDRFVEAALAGPSSISGFWRRNNVLFQAAIMPLSQDQDLIGFLMLADRVGDALGKAVGSASGADVAYLLPTDRVPIVIGSSLDPALLKVLTEALEADVGGLAAAIASGQDQARLDISFGGERWVARTAMLDADGGPVLGSALQLVSLDRLTAGYRQILNVIAVAGCIALVVALLVSLLLANATLRPVRRMAKVAQEAAGGNYQAQIGIRGSDELAQLSRAFDSLLSDLRERKDIERYVTNLSRFLPEPGQVESVPSFVTQPGVEAAAEVPAVPVQPAERKRLLLLAIELREAARPLPNESAATTLARNQANLAAVVRVFRRQGARVLAVAGHRVVAGFEPERPLSDMLGVCRQVQELAPGSAAAALEGEVVFGTMDTGGDSLRAAVGPSAFQIDRLLSEGPVDRLVLPKALGERVRADLGAAAVVVVQGLSSGKSFYGVPREQLPAAPVESVVTPDEALTAVVALPQAPSGQQASRQSALRPGMRFGGRYDILSVLGEGGMGVVYKARDIELDDVVALKTLRPSALVDGEQLERLKSEIRLARKITHPNVLRTFDFGEAMGLPYISMEYVRGMTLRYLLRQAGRVPYSGALRIARQHCAGLAAAHAGGVLHRDIKPENLILESNGNVKLMDFGIARPIQRSGGGPTQPGMFMGTPQYSAPEQLTGEAVDQRADLYATGVVLCEMFCGKPPFTGANTMEIYLAQMNAQSIRPSELWPDVPKPLEAIILKCIAPKPDERYQTAEELGLELAGLRA